MQHYKNFFRLFDQQDELNKPKDNINLFVGSSTFRHWETMNEDFAPKDVLNRGFGGSTMRQLLEFHEQLILRYKFKHIFIYEGDNDIGKDKRKIPVVIGQLNSIVDIINNHQPEAKIYILSLKCSPFRKKNCPTVLLANIELEKYCQTRSYLTYVDIESGFFDNDNEIREEFFKDGIHPCKQGYQHITNIVKPLLFPENSTLH